MRWDLHIIIGREGENKSKSKRDRGRERQTEKQRQRENKRGKRAKDIVPNKTSFLVFQQRSPAFPKCVSRPKLAQGVFCWISVSLAFC